MKRVSYPEALGKTFAAACLALALASCSSTQPAAPQSRLEPSAAPAAVASPPREVVLAEAERHYLAGRAAHEIGDAATARLEFDRALEVLLLSGADIAKDPVLEATLDRYAEEIWAIDRKQHPGLAAEPPPNSAAIDDLALLDEILGETPATPDAELLRDELAAQADDPVLAVPLNDEVLALLEVMRWQRREWFAQGWRRSGLYMPMMQRVLRGMDVPPELAYLALVESAYKPNARSRAAAQGIWQFVSGTAKVFGLSRTAWVDERSDPEKSTRAAARYLRYLHGMFGDWEMALAAYNCGEGCVQRAARRAGTWNFWELSRRGLLPRETRNYVPAVLATILIARDPGRFGFAEERDSPLQWDLVVLDAPVDLRVVARVAAVPLSELQFLNPELRRLLTPAGRHGYELRVPRGSGGRVEEELAGLAPSRRALEERHRVAKGETLATIASHYGVSQRAILSHNGLKTGKSLKHGRTLVIPLDPGDARVLSAATRPTATQDRLAPVAAAVPAVETYANPETGERPQQHLVATGDTLFAIARRYGVSVETLRTTNGLKRSATLYPGRTLRLP